MPVPDNLRRTTPRREAALAAATRLFNRHSFAAVTLEAIAAEIGVTASALYNYFDSKEALVFECFSRGLRLYRDELGRANEAGIDGLETVRRFIRGRLRPGEPRMITFSDLDALPRAHRTIIHDARAGNVALLRSVISRGISEGSIAPCDAFLTSLAIFSILDWMPFWYSERQYYTRQEAAGTLDDIIAHGILRRDVPPAPVPEHQPLLGQIDRVPALGKRGAKRDRLLRMATESFNQRGVVGSSIDHIAADAGVSRGAYYYHAPDKTTLLFLCLERAYNTESMLLAHLDRQFDSSGQTVAATVDFEYRLMRGIFELHASDLGPKISFHNVPFLSDQQKADLVLLDRELVGRNRSRYDRARAAGVFRAVDTLFVQEVGSGLRNNMPNWSRLLAGHDPLETADSFTRLFLYGLKPRGVTGDQVAWQN